MAALAAWQTALTKHPDLDPDQRNDATIPLVQAFLGPLGEELYTHYPCLDAFACAWRIQFPVSAFIERLPFFVAAKLFPEEPGYWFRIHFSRHQPTEVTFRLLPGASKDAVMEDLGDLVSTLTASKNVTLRAKKHQPYNIEYYRELFAIYDLHMRGMSDRDIAQQFWPKEFQLKEHSYVYPNKGKHPLVQKIRDRRKRVNALIDAAQK
jgi:hypothetical protein